MRTLPPDPKPGDKISATLIRDLIRAIRERTPVAGSGVKVSIGPNGFVLSAKSSGSAKTGTERRCFDIVNVEHSEEDETTTVTLTRCHFAIGAKLFYARTDCDVEILSGQLLLALKVNFNSAPAVNFECFSSVTAFNETAADEDNKNLYYFPLYLFDENYNVDIDFRNMPSLNAWEFE